MSYRTIAFQQIRSVHEEQRGARHREIVAVLRETDRQIRAGGVGMVTETLDWIGRLDIFGAPSEPSIDLSILHGFREQNKKSGYIYIYISFNRCTIR